MPPYNEPSMWILRKGSKFSYRQVGRDSYIHVRTAKRRRIFQEVDDTGSMYCLTLPCV